MEHILHALIDFHLTPWKIVGFLGSVIFGARWLVQFYATRKRKRVTMPMLFWYMSVCGSLLTLAYFIFGKNDAVGIVSNLFPMFVALYNVRVHRRERANPEGGAPA
ncbi:MAG TPA: lipid-A-disaccharide synthase N-terminal domain-containing protein [Rhodanobacteraceae bacterium]